MAVYATVEDAVVLLNVHRRNRFLSVAVVSSCTGPMVVEDPGPMMLVSSIANQSAAVSRRNVVDGTAAVSA